MTTYDKIVVGQDFPVARAMVEFEKGGIKSLCCAPLHVLHFPPTVTWRCFNGLLYTLQPRRAINFVCEEGWLRKGFLPPAPYQKVYESFEDACAAVPVYGIRMSNGPGVKVSPALAMWVVRNLNGLCLYSPLQIARSIELKGEMIGIRNKNLFLVCDWSGDKLDEKTELTFIICESSISKGSE